MDDEVGYKVTPCGCQALTTAGTQLMTLLFLDSAADMYGQQFRHERLPAYVVEN